MPSTLDSALTTAYRALLEDRFGLRLSDQQTEQLDEIVPQLLAMTRYAGPCELVEAFASGWRADLLQVLATRMTVGETHFFRVPAQIHALERVVLPETIARHATDRRLRVWSAGCSTGEEPYTLAILVRQQLADRHAWDVDILGTDLSLPALEAARRASYGEWSFRDTPNYVRQRYFHQDGKRWRLQDDVARMVRFEPLNLIADPFPSPGPEGPTLDLLVCRNVTIYFTPEAIRRLYRRFAEALVPGGWLVLGPSDPIPDAPELLAAVNAPGAVLWQRLPGAGLTTAPRSGLGSHDRRPRRPRPLHAQLARTVAEQPVPDRPLEGDGYTRQGMLDLENGALDQAIDNLRRATFLSPHDALAQFSLGRAYSLLGQRSRARTALAHARQLLAAMADDQAVAGGGGIWAAELRQAVEAELASVTRTGER